MMPRDDYFVLAYKILAYLYTKLKAGEDVDPTLLAADGPLLKVPERYWTYILDNLQKQGFIQGVILVKAWGAEVIVESIDKIQITPEGIAFLQENSLMEKAKAFLKEAKEMIPFV